MIIRLVELVVRMLLIVALLLLQIVVGVVIALLRLLLPLVIRGLTSVWQRVRELMRRRHLGAPIGDTRGYERYWRERTTTHTVRENADNDGHRMRHPP